MALLRASLVVSLNFGSTKNFILTTIRRNIPKKLSPKSSYGKTDIQFSNLHFTRNFLAKGILKHPRHIYIKTGNNLAIISSSIREIHTSQKLNALPPLLIILLRPIINVAAIIFGRTFRKWWQSLPPKQKEIIREKFKENRVVLIALATAFVGMVIHYYLSHLEEDPITKRWRFIAFTHEQMVQISNIELKNLLHEFQGMILKPSHYEYTRVVKVANRILKSNLDLPGIKNREWSVTVVGHPTQRNAFVLPDGKIFIFTGMLDICDNDDQLGVILAHEMSHAILSHMAEQLSSVQLIDWLLLIPLVIFWAVLPDGAALFSQWLSGRIASLMFHLPFSRAIETEADQVGLELAAKACFDIREASAFWAKMAILSEDEEVFEWLSTHPSHESREHILNSMMGDAIKRRANYKCPVLPLLDPRSLISTHRAELRRSQLTLKQVDVRSR